MTNQSIIYEIAYKLDTHTNSRRIKKLIFCACKNIWQNDQQILNTFKSSELIQELYDHHPTIEHVNYTLSQIVNTLNKPGEYSIVANTILGELEKLYVTHAENTEIVLNYAHSEESTHITYHQNQQEISASLVEELKNHQIKYEYNPFDLRQNIMKYTNPLRAKIVLFSALNNQFNFQNDDWSKLKQENLDTLLQKLFASCETFEELEIKLNNSIVSLGDQDETIQSVGAILQFMRSLYGNISCHPYQHQPKNQYHLQEDKLIVNSEYQLATTDIDDFDFYEDDQGNTCQFIEPPKINMFRQEHNN
ncbi:hypothetical protein WJM97_17130 [Okeanomitos corallinicola TIOX110]|uniref:Uncharacterized protein n=1 Tax=Okeanomitos corallinicola TIOX110 TaxID=3133117 RepID=A0ABZ2UNY8_9CYAN